MKISELIKQLEKYENMMGDMEVVTGLPEKIEGVFGYKWSEHEITTIRPRGNPVTGLYIEIS